MKKSFKFLAILLCVVLAAFVFTACSDAGAPEHSTANPDYAVSQEELENELSEFLKICYDRTSFNMGEQSAAIYLKQRLINYGYTDAELQDFTMSENSVSNLKSTNVSARYGATEQTENTKNVIIGACYDNRYGEAYKDATVFKSEGALVNGTGVATLLVIAKYLKQAQPQLDFNVTIVFFGGSFITDEGARAYYRQMSREERANTVLMIELQRLGVDNVYAFSDVRETRRESFFDGISAENGLNVYKITQKSPLVTSVKALEGVPYFQWAHNGVIGVFFDAGIPTLNIVGANWETIDITDAESADHDNIGYTQNDNLETLKKLYPAYAQKMATAATLVIRSFESENFLSTMEQDKANFPDTSVLTKSWIWYLVTLGIIILAAAVMMLIASHLNKKYKVVAPQPKRMKMAVFGMDYEDKNSSDIFIDIKDAPTAADEDIFPGVPNNDKNVGAGMPFDEIFAPLFGMPITKSKTEQETPPVQEEQSAKAEVKEEKPTPVEEASKQPAEQDSENTTADKSDDNDKTDTAVKQKPSAPKRKTTSAGKSTSAKKTVNAGGGKKSEQTDNTAKDKADSNTPKEDKE